MDNILLLSDSYKVSHWKQYPEGSEVVYSYFESRGGVYSDVVFFGLQYFLKRYLCGEVVTRAKIDQAAKYYGAHFFPCAPQFYQEGWEYILEAHKGHLPVKIRAAPEGTVIGAKNVLFTMENTDPKCFWLTNYLETLLVQVWYPMTVASHSRAQKSLIEQFMVETGGATFFDEPPGPNLPLQYKLHDFGFRGVSSVESAGIGGAAHLVNFVGTDTVAAMVVAHEYYGAAVDAAATPVPACPGYSLPASEHSTITSWGRDAEGAAMSNMLDSYPAGPVACVSDSYDVFKACSDLWGTELKEKIMAREGTLVVRPDSGDPPTTALKVLELLGEKFGAPENAKGFKTLDSHVRVIWGDGIDYEMLGLILTTLRDAGWSADNIAFGSGGGLLQKLNRDTQKCAFKCSAITVKGEERVVFKDPITDPGKRSKKGRLTLHRLDDGGWCTKMGDECDPATDVLQDVFENGVLLVDQTFDEIRARAATTPPPAPSSATPSGVCCEIT